MFTKAKMRRTGDTAKAWRATVILARACLILNTGVVINFQSNSLLKSKRKETITNNTYRSQESGQQDLVSLALQSSKVAMRLITFTLYLIF